jgi:type IV secretory pathway VirB6-like protein
MIKDGVPDKHFIRGFENSIFVSIFNKSNITIFKNSLKENIKYTSKVLYIDFTNDIPILIAILIVKTILISICTPNSIGSHLTKNITIDVNIQESINFRILIDFLEIIYIPHIIINPSGILLKKNSIQVSFNIFNPPFLPYLIYRTKNQI